MQEIMHSGNLLDDLVTDLPLSLFCRQHEHKVCLVRCRLFTAIKTHEIPLFVAANPLSGAP